jgi:hypothetical protein
MLLEISISPVFLSHCFTDISAGLPRVAVTFSMVEVIYSMRGPLSLGVSEKMRVPR